MTLAAFFFCRRNKLNLVLFLEFKEIQPEMLQKKMDAQLVVFLLSLAGLVKSMGSASCNLDAYSATTPNIKEIFLGRCNYFINVAQKNNCNFNSSNYDCSQLWQSFYSAIKKPTCSIDDYNDFFRLTDHFIPPNQSLFWSGTMQYANAISKAQHYWAIGDTLNGFLLDALTFCVSSNTNEFIYDIACPQADCKFRNFWNAASRKFAQQASGNIFVVLNGTRTYGALSNTSTFYLHELPQITSTSINKVSVLLLHNPDQPKYETCANGKSIKVLQQILADRNIDFECTDNPKSLVFYMCFEDPLSNECKNVRFPTNSSDRLIFSLRVVFGILLLNFIRFQTWI
jgi:hypothetical protein